MATVRLGFYARQLPAISVAAAKSYALTAWASVWLLWLAYQRAQSGQGVASLWEGVGQPFAWLLVVWSALGPGALAAFLQTQVTILLPKPSLELMHQLAPRFGIE